MKQIGIDLVGRWHWIVLGLVLGVLGGLYYTSKTPKLYRMFQARSIHRVDYQ